MSMRKKKICVLYIPRRTTSCFLNSRTSNALKVFKYKECQYLNIISESCYNLDKPRENICGRMCLGPVIKAIIVGLEVKMLQRRRRGGV